MYMYMYSTGNCIKNTTVTFALPPLSLSLSLSLSLQLYKQTVHNTVAEFIPLTMKTIVLQPSAKARQAPDFNREAYVDFVAVQIKFLSFLAYIIRIYQDQVGGRTRIHTQSYNVMGLKDLRLYLRQSSHCLLRQT
jgi:hypothetical protein